jgi:hypothetical protein
MPQVVHSFRMDRIATAPLAPFGFLCHQCAVNVDPEPLDAEAHMKRSEPAPIKREQTNNPEPSDEASRSTANSASSTFPSVTSPNHADPLLTPEQASAYLGGVPGVKTLELYRARGNGPQWIALARRVYYRRSALDAYLEACVQVTRPRKRARAAA